MGAIDGIGAAMGIEILAIDDLDRYVVGDLQIVFDCEGMPGLMRASSSPDSPMTRSCPFSRINISSLGSPKT